MDVRSKCPEERRQVSKDGYGNEKVPRERRVGVERFKISRNFRIEFTLEEVSLTILNV